MVIIRDGITITGDDLLNLFIKNKDILKTTSHKHEAHVVDFGKIPILYQDENMIVVNKPSSIPVHPTGRFYYNSITESIKLQENLSNIFPCYRLDKLTSGVLVLCKNSKTAGIIQKKINEKGISKNYYARVIGNFPNDEIILNQPVSHVVPKLGYTYGKGNKKSAITIFNKIRYNPKLNQSIVLCKPLTGRTHQIRIHLNFLSHSIVNDPLYGPNSSQIRHKIINSKIVSQNDFNQLINEFNEGYKNLKIDHFCNICGYKEFQDEDPKNLVMYLHAIKYESNDGEWCYETPEPEWANI